MRGEYVFVFFHSLIYMSLLHRETPYKGLGGCNDFPCSISLKYEEEKSPYLKYYIHALLSSDDIDCCS